MKRNLLVTSLLASGVILAACGQNDGETANTGSAATGTAESPRADAPAAPAAAATAAQLTRVDFAVEGMTCGGCDGEDAALSARVSDGGRLTSILLGPILLRIRSS